MYSTVCKSSALVLALALAQAGLGCGGSDKQSDTADLATDEVPTSHRATAPPTTDDEDDEGLEVEGLKGRLEPYQVEAGLKPHHGALAKCYQTQFKRKKFLGGKIQLEAVVGPDGTVSQVRAVESEIGSWPVESCLLDTMAQATFAKPKGGDRIATFKVPLDFTGKTSVLWWPEERIQTVVDENLVALEACASETETTEPSDVWVTVYIGVKGKVKSVGFASPASDVPPEWAECAVEAVSQWTMPDPRGRMAKTAFRYNP